MNPMPLKVCPFMKMIMQEVHRTLYLHGQFKGAEESTQKFKGSKVHLSLIISIIVMYVSLRMRTPKHISVAILVPCEVGA